MASIFKPTRKVIDPKTGKTTRVPYEKWYIKYIDANGRPRKVKGFTDRVATQQKAAELERLAMRGIDERSNSHRKRPLAEHVADFKAYLESKGSVPNHVSLTIARINAVIAGCKFQRIADLSPSRVSTYLADLRKSTTDATGKQIPGKSRSTTNGYLVGMKTFCNWLVKDRRADDNPLASLSKLNVETDIRRERRALSQRELANLINAAAESSDSFRGLNGTDRSMLYRVAAYTGLRASELASLSEASFDMASDPPTVTVEAGYSKHRRKDELPLHPELAEVLRQWLASRRLRPDAESIVPIVPDVSNGRTDRLWPGTWASNRRAAEMLRSDLAAAGIPYVDDAGRVADFHALRHSFISLLVQQGVHPKLAQQLARHSTITLTMDRYTHVGLVDMTTALESIPALPRPDNQFTTVLATGTDDAAPGQVSESWDHQWDQKPDAGCQQSIRIANSVGMESESRKGERPRHLPMPGNNCEPVRMGMREEGLEPSRVSPPDPKSGAYANSATLAWC